MTTTTEKTIICHPFLRSSLPGRERWESTEIKHQDIVCTYISTFLQAENGINEVVVNTKTGRILVLFDVSLCPSGSRQSLSNCLQRVSNKVKYFSYLLPTEKSPQNSQEKNHEKNSTLLVNVSSLPKFIKKVTEDHESLTPLLSYSAINALVKIAVPLSAGLAVSSTVLGGLPVLAKIGLKSPVAQLALLAGSYFGLTALEGYLENRRSEKWTKYANTFEHDTRMEVMNHIRNMDSADQDAQTTSDLLAVIDTDVSSIRNFLQAVPHSAVEKSLTFAIAGFSLAIISPVSLILALTPLPVIHHFTGKTNAKTQSAYQAKAQGKDQLNQKIDDNLQGLTTIKEFTSESLELAHFEEASSNYHQIASQTDNDASRSGTLIKYGINFATVIPMVYNSFQVILEKQNFRSFSIQSAFLPSLVMAAQDIHQDVHLYQTAKVAKHRLDKILAASPKINDGEIALPLKEVRGDFKLNDISFGYRKKEHIIKNINLHIAPGKVTALVGTTGSGKSTIVRLLMRLYDTTEGNITLDGHKLTDLNVHDLRKSIAIVSQDVHLFNGSVTENILYGRPEASLSDMYDAAKQAQASEFIQALPNGFDTPLGSSGVKLSGGQRQRLSLARAILKDAPILVLDEATSAVDNETEFEIQKSIIDNVMSQRTTIIIAHRLSTVRQSDCIHVISKGTVTESGTHQQLLDAEGHYARLWGLQINNAAS